MIGFPTPETTRSSILGTWRFTKASSRRVVNTLPRPSMNCLPCGLAALLVMARLARADDGQTDDDAWRFVHTVSVNPYKPVLGLVALQYDVRISQRWSMKLMAEYMVHNVFDWEHPRLVAFVGPRYYPFVGAENACCPPHGAFVGVQIGYAYEDYDAERHRSFGGIEVGYDYAFARRWLVTPRALLSVPFADPEVLLGAEVLLGFRF